MSRFALLTLFIASAASAQISLTFGQNAPTASFAPSACNNQATLTWSVVATQQVCGPLELFVATTTCGDQPGVNDLDLGSQQLNIGTTSGTKTIQFNELPDFSGSTDGGSSCGAAAEKTWKVCAVYQANNAGFGAVPCGTKLKVEKSTTISYDGKPPAAPSLTDATGIDRGIRARAAASGDAKLVRFGTRLKDSTDPFDFRTEAVIEGDGAEGRIGGLENGFDYEVAAVAVDAAGNTSTQSAVIEATPTETLGFWDAYKKAGGTEQGGCASAPGLFASAAVMFGLWISRRKRS